MRLNWIRATTLGVATAALLSACATTPPPPPALGGTPANIVAHLREHPARDFTIVTLGPKELSVSSEK